VQDIGHVRSGKMDKAKYLNPERNYTEKQLAFLEAMAGEAKGNINQAIKLAGYGAVSAS
jgi:hypothetical protein